MRPGIFAKTFAGTDPAAVLKAAKSAGYGVVQWNMACAGLAPMPDAIPADTCAAIRDAAARAGVAIAAVSGTYNMIHPDRSERARGLRRLSVMIDAAEAMDTGMVTLCTGTRHPTDLWSPHPDNASADAWRDLMVEMAKACTLAEARGIRLGIEPELANVVDGALKARALIDTLQSPALAVVLDPANLFEVADAATRRDTIARAVDLLADRIAMAHAKDRHADGRFATAGTGVVDFPHFVGCLRAAGFDGDLITHGLSEAEAAGVARFLRGLA